MERTKISWRSMKKVIIIFILTFTISACAVAPRLILKFQERRYRFCEDEEVKRLRPSEDAIGKVCFRYCSNRSIFNNCKLWKTDIMDLSNPEDFYQFRSAGFVLINEGRID